MVSRTGTFLILFFVLSVNQINCDSTTPPPDETSKVITTPKVDVEKKVDELTSNPTTTEAEDMNKTTPAPAKIQPVDTNVTDGKMNPNPSENKTTTQKPAEENSPKSPAVTTEVPKTDKEEKTTKKPASTTPLVPSSSTSGTLPSSTSTPSSTSSTSSPSSTSTTLAPTPTQSLPSSTASPTTANKPSSESPVSTTEPEKTEKPVNTTTPTPMTIVDNPRKTSTGYVVLMAALCFTFTVVLTYFGLVLWRRYMTNRYGNRQLLVNEMEFDATTDFPRFEL